MPPQRPVFWMIVDLAMNLGFIIALPLILLGLGGRWLDHKYGTSPMFLLGGIVLAMVVTGIALVRKFADFKKMMDVEETEHKT